MLPARRCAIAPEGSPQKITYATLAAPSEELHQALEAALSRQQSTVGQDYPLLIGGREVRGNRQFQVHSPTDTRMLLGQFQKADAQQAHDAIAAARAAIGRWAGTDWRERLRILRNATDIISSRAHDLAARMMLEVGKTRMEALGDVEESAEFLRYYCGHIEAANGFEQSMTALSANETTRDKLRPYGVWLVISPFNFPLALAAGPVAAALVAGNTVVLKPSSDAPTLGIELGRILMEAGVPDGAINVVTGAGAEVGQALVDHPDVAGLTFTGSYDVGMALVRGFSREVPRPCIAEMGGKNPTIVTRHADLDKAAEGIVRSAFGFSGQKCSACSRVYVESSVRDELMELIKDKTIKLQIGDPAERATFTGPVIRRDKVSDFRRAVDLALSDGHIVTGGGVLTEGDFAHGHFVELTVVDGLPHEHELMRQEQFLPLVGVMQVSSLDEALRLSNDSMYGLTAGIYTEDTAEQERFFDRIEAGVAYVNRRAGATTGAWPGSQAFGGWKGSASTGRGSGGPYYLQQYLREQSQTVIS